MGHMQSSNISAVSRAMDVLSILADHPQGRTVTQVAEELGLGKPMASRILTTLTGAGYVVQSSSSGSYRLAFKTVTLAHRFLDRGGFQEVAQHVLDRLALASCECVELFVVEEDRLHCVASAQTPNVLQVQSRIGRIAPAHATAPGKAWLATLPEDEAVAIATRSGLARFGPRTITDVPELIAELRRTAGRGYAIAIEEGAEGVAGVAAPIKVHSSGRAVGSLTIAGPVERMVPMDRFIDSLRGTASEVADVWPRYWPGVGQVS